MKKKYFATIDNKNLMEDGFEDYVFEDLMPATDHRKKGSAPPYRTQSNQGR